jgi:hypothetical protein
MGDGQGHRGVVSLNINIIIPQGLTAQGMT